MRSFWQLLDAVATTIIIFLVDNFCWQYSYFIPTTANPYTIEKFYY